MAHGPHRGTPAFGAPRSSLHLRSGPVSNAGVACQAVAGKARNVPAGDFQNLVNEGYIVLDVRPHTEREKAPLVDAVEVPLFVPDEEMSVSTLIKKSTAFGMGGWWLGGTSWHRSRR